MGEAAPAAAVLAVNGERYEAAGVDPSTTLLEFLRTRTPVRGPKLGCGEGTCHLSLVLVHPFALAPAFISSSMIQAQEETTCQRVADFFKVAVECGPSVSSLA
jgi:aerobic-type carbon monoxide dehydrogenase small subunit (CoxS/CutS family)